MMSLSHFSDKLRFFSLHQKHKCYTATLALLAAITCNGIGSNATVWAAPILSNFTSFDACQFQPNDFTHAGLPAMSLLNASDNWKRRAITYVNDQVITTDDCTYINTTKQPIHFLIEKYSSSQHPLSASDFLQVYSPHIPGQKVISVKTSIHAYPSEIVTISDDRMHIEKCGIYIYGVFFYFDPKSPRAPMPQYCGKTRALKRFIDESVILQKRY